MERARARASELGLDPESHESRLVGLESAATAWEAIVTFEIGARGAVPTGIELRSTAGERINRKVWDRLRVAQVIGEAAALVAWLAPLSHQPQIAKAFEGSAGGSPRRGRPPTYSDDHYRRVAQVHLAALASKETKVRSAPVRAVARAFVHEFPGLTDSDDMRPRSWVRECRARGYVP